jgi:membrane protein YdbS with pleckstrin-like domain
LQDVYVDQDILDRIFSLYDVHVSSATIISGNLSHIDGLNKENAQAIKNLILSGIHKESD